MCIIYLKQLELGGAWGERAVPVGAASQINQVAISYDASRWRRRSLNENELLLKKLRACLALGAAQSGLTIVDGPRHPHAAHEHSERRPSEADSVAISPRVRAGTEATRLMHADACNRTTTSAHREQARVRDRDKGYGSGAPCMPPKNAAHGSCTLRMWPRASSARCTSSSIRASRLIVSADGESIPAPKALVGRH
eukprot:COSAG04_NODE_7344_length_1144_cov_1.065072_2_plen_196_part_00